MSRQYGAGNPKVTVLSTIDRLRIKFDQSGGSERNGLGRTTFDPGDGKQVNRDPLAGQPRGQKNWITRSCNPASTISIPADWIIHSDRWSRYSRTFVPDLKASTVTGLRAATMVAGRADAPQCIPR